MLRSSVDLVEQVSQDQNQRFLVWNLHLVWNTEYSRVSDPYKKFFRGQKSRKVASNNTGERCSDHDNI